MTFEEFKSKAREILLNQTPNRYVFGILQLNNLIERGLEEGISADLMNEYLHEEFDDCYVSKMLMNIEK